MLTRPGVAKLNERLSGDGAPHVLRYRATNDSLNSFSGYQDGASLRRFGPP